MEDKEERWREKKGKGGDKKRESRKRKYLGGRLSNLFSNLLRNKFVKAEGF
jgi:hypothetical protein